MSKTRSQHYMKTLANGTEGEEEFRRLRQEEDKGAGVYYFPWAAEVEFKALNEQHSWAAVRAGAIWKRDLVDEDKVVEVAQSPKDEAIQKKVAFIQKVYEAKMQKAAENGDLDAYDDLAMECSNKIVEVREGRDKKVVKTPTPQQEVAPKVESVNKDSQNINSNNKEK